MLGKHCLHHQTVQKVQIPQSPSSAFLICAAKVVAALASEMFSSVSG